MHFEEYVQAINMTIFSIASAEDAHALTEWHGGLPADSEAGQWAYTHNASQSAPERLARLLGEMERTSDQDCWSPGLGLLQ